MYFGRLRYWLYSLHMNKKITAVVQKDADILWWSREPKLEANSQGGIAQKNATRIKGWVRKQTAIGPRKEGGLNNMDWDAHSSCFRAQWFLRYLHPAESSWKDIMDTFLLEHKSGEIKYPEGRSIIIMQLSTYQKMENDEGYT
jgi:hypothetical protein